jgi:hypothetical protein
MRAGCPNQPRSLLFPDAFERLAVCLLVDDSALLRVNLDPIAGDRVANLDPILDRSNPVMASRRRILGHGLVLTA